MKGSGHWTPSHFRCSELTASKANPSPVECCDQSHLPHQVNLISFCTSPISNSQWPSPPFFPSILWSQSSLSWITPYSWYLSSTFEKPRQQGQKIWHGERRRQPEQPNGDVDNTAGASFSVVLFTTLLSRHPHILKDTRPHRHNILPTLARPVAALLTTRSSARCLQIGFKCLSRLAFHTPSLLMHPTPQKRHKTESKLLAFLCPSPASAHLHPQCDAYPRTSF